MMREESKESTLNLYASDGTPTRTVRLAPEASSQNFAYDGRSIAVWQSGERRVLDLSGKCIARFKPRPDGMQASDWPLLIVAQGRELWMLEPATKTLHRFEMP
jgi:hypothetical protein